MPPPRRDATVDARSPVLSKICLSLAAASSTFTEPHD
jgi:hypothetical protein